MSKSWGNFTFELGIEQFKQMYSTRKVDSKGIIEETYFDNIKKGVELSHIVERNIQDLIRKSRYNK